MMKTQTALRTKLEVLRPLLDASPHGGEIFVARFRGGKAICLSCGAIDDQIMMRNHKKNCTWKAYWRAIEALQEMLDGSVKPKKARRER